MYKWSDAVGSRTSKFIIETVISTKANLMSVVVRSFCSKSSFVWSPKMLHNFFSFKDEKNIWSVCNLTIHKYCTSPSQPLPTVSSCLEIISVVIHNFAAILFRICAEKWLLPQSLADQLIVVWHLIGTLWNKRVSNIIHRVCTCYNQIRSGFIQGYKKHCSHKIVMKEKSVTLKW